MWLLQRADEGIGPYGTRKASGYFVGADALVRPLVQGPHDRQGARSSCAAVGGSTAYGCGVPLAGKAERAEGGTSGTLVTEILGAPQRETVKEKLVKCVLAPRRRRHHPPRDGSCKLAEDYSVPVGQPKSEQAPIRRPSSRGGPLHRSAPKRFFLFHRARRILFLSRTKREWGAHPRGNGPLAEPASPWPPFGGPHFPRPRRPGAFLNPHLHAPGAQIAFQFSNVHLPGVER